MTKTMKSDSIQIDRIKKERLGQQKYRLRNANVLMAKNGVLFTDYLDPLQEIDPEISGKDLDEDTVTYIEKSLETNATRAEKEVATVAQFLALEGAKILDIGCGGGRFLSAVKAQGADVTGVELDDSRAFYASQKYDFEVVKRPIESDYWNSRADKFDAVSLWDVIEHVNFPFATLHSSHKLLRAGAYLFIDTPCKDSFYHRVGQLTYAMSFGRFPTFLNIMYSDHPFGHKQILSTQEIRGLLESVGFEVVKIEKFHELSFPISYYLRKLTRSEFLTRLLTPMTTLAMKLLRIKNKMLVVAKKPDAPVQS